MSKALDMSSATAMVLSGGCLLLKPVVIWLFIVFSAVVVECWGLKPCWCLIVGILSVISGNMIFSRVLAIGDRRAMGL